MSLFSESLSRAPTHALDLGRHIDLTDNTLPARDDQASDLDVNEILPLVLKRTSSWVNPARLKEELSKRKYAKYSEDRYNQDALHNAILDPSSSTSKLAAIIKANATDEETEMIARMQSHVSRDSRIRRGQRKIKGLLNYRRKTRGIQDSDTEIDVLYENQRGSWLFGNPLFSSKSLLNFDPAPWTTALGDPSTVNITNAQLPDPSWEWIWKTWYVDMSLDVDEQGWQYNFMFKYNFAWHGTHPWFHSFVRRRRWIRKRARQGSALALAPLDDIARKDGAPTHKLNADYFSVRAAGGAKNMGSSAYDLSLSEVLSTDRSLGTSRQAGTDDELDDIQTLLRKLKRSNVDREKIHLVLEYMEWGGEDTCYLADEMPHIMSTLIFQHSRRELFARMLRAVEEREKSRTNVTDVAVHEKGKQAEATESDDVTRPAYRPGAETPLDQKARKQENLIRAVRAADRELTTLEFWSDVRQAESTAESLGTAATVVDSDGRVT